MLLLRERAKFSPARRKVKIAAGIVKAMSRTQFGLTTLPPEEIAAVRSKNEFLEVPLKRTYPDVAKAYGIVVGREAERQFFGDCPWVSGQDSMAGPAVDFLVVMDENAVVKDGDISGLFEFSGFEDGCEEDNIERLPLAGIAAGIYHWRTLGVNGGRLAVGIKFLGV